MARIKLAKKQKINKVQAQKALMKANLLQIDNIFSVPAKYCNVYYVTSHMQAKSTFVRLTFCENVPDLGKANPVTAVSLSAEDLQRLYDMIGVQLQQFREQKRLD